MRRLCAAVSTAAFLCLLPACAPSAPPPNPYDVMRMETVRVGSVNGHGHGSGVIVSPNFILTVAHVPDNAGKTMDVKFYDGTTGTATLAWEDKDRDVALMKLAKPTKLKPAVLSQGLPHIGDTIYAAGYPLFLPLSIQGGTIASADPANMQLSDKAKGLPYLRPLAAVVILNCIVVPGDSGGPVFNEAGEVVGINDLQFTNEETPGISGLSGMIGIQFIIGDVFAQIASA